MTGITYITGNQNKAERLSAYLGFPLLHQKVDLDEIQSLDIRTVVEHKVRQAYAQTGSPVLVEDTSLEFTALGRLPGTFIKFFLEDVPPETICRMLDNLDRTATARTMFSYFDGTEPVFIESSVGGRIADHPAGTSGFGWDVFFIQEGTAKTRAELNDQEYEAAYTKSKPIAQVKAFLETLG